MGFHATTHTPGRRQTTGRQRAPFTYDYLGRRVRKVSQASVLSPAGAQVCSQGREPLVQDPTCSTSPGGAAEARPAHASACRIRNGMVVADTGPIARHCLGRSVAERGVSCRAGL
jgi:hypothetical protein